MRYAFLRTLTRSPRVAWLKDSEAEGEAEAVAQAMSQFQYGKDFLLNKPLAAVAIRALDAHRAKRLR